MLSKQWKLGKISQKFLQLELFSFLCVEDSVRHYFHSCSSARVQLVQGMLKIIRKQLKPAKETEIIFDGSMLKDKRISDVV